jgi:hypothetical protein
MKKTILSTTFLIAGTIGVLAQGLLDFSNAPWELWPPPTSTDRLIYVGDSIATGVPVPTDQWTAALFENRGGNWVKLGDSLPFFGTGFEGIIANDGVQRVVSVAAGVQTTLKIEVIDPTGLPTRVTEGNNSFSFTQGTSIPASPTDTLMVNMRAFSVVPIPEPSTIALGVLGIGALLLFRRRK